MQSFLISSKDRQEALKKTMFLCSQKKIDKIDIEYTNFEKLVGIEDVRIIQKKIYLKPIKGDTKAIVLAAFNGLTIEAQNALLKILEEPPNNTIIILVVINTEQVLPTILSRCKVIAIGNKKEEFSKKEVYQIIEILSSLPAYGVGMRLKLAQDFGKSREEAIVWLEKMIILLRESIIEEINKNQAFEQSKIKTLEKIQDTYTIIKTTNVNQRFALENLFLSI